MPPYHDDDIPAVASELASLVADRNQPEERRHRALERLVPLIEENAWQTAARFPEWLRNDLREESRTIVWLRVHQFDPSLGRFEDWCRVVLHNYGVDLLRKSRKGLVRPATGGQAASTAVCLPATTAPEETSDQVMQRCRELRAVLDSITWLPPRGVNYFAVLLVQLRLSMIRRLIPNNAAQEISSEGQIPDLVEWLLPWHPHEEQASFKSGWPSLSQLWSALRSLAGHPGSAMGAPVLCQTLDRLLPPWVRLTPDLWHHWVHRAKDNARCRLQDESIWIRCFGRLLPDR